MDTVPVIIYIFGFVIIFPRLDSYYRDLCEGWWDGGCGVVNPETRSLTLNSTQNPRIRIDI